MKHLHMEVLSAPPLPRLCNLTARDGLSVKHMGVTVERAWRNNEPDISCVPAGEYELIEYESPTRGRVLVLKNLLWGCGYVPGRGGAEHVPDSQR